MLWHPELNLEGGPYKTVLKRGEFIDPARLEEDGTLREVPFKAYIPVDHGLERMPVIIWSHGFGGNRDGAAFLSRYIASHGYAIVHITHRGTDSSLWEGKPGHPWDILREVKVSRENSLNRFKDVPFVLDQLPGWASAGENAEFGRFLDFKSLGMSGHSFGAMTSQVMAGMKFPDIEGNLMSLKEPRFKAGILYSPVPIAHLSDAAPEELYGGIDLPLLHMTGTQDDSPIENFGYEHRLAVHEHSGTAEKHLLVKKDGDHMVYNGTRGKLEASDLRERHEDIIKAVALAYWDYQLKGDKSAREWLEGEGAQSFLNADADFQVAT